MIFLLAMMVFGAVTAFGMMVMAMLSGDEQETALCAPSEAQLCTASTAPGMALLMAAPANDVEPGMVSGVILRIDMRRELRRVAGQ